MVNWENLFRYKSQNSRPWSHPSGVWFDLGPSNSVRMEISKGYIHPRPKWGDILKKIGAQLGLGFKNPWK